MALDSACSNRLPSVKFVGDTLSVSALIGLVTLTFDLLTLNLVRVIAREAEDITHFYLNINLHGDLDLRAFDLETGALYCTLLTIKKVAEHL